MVTRFGYDDAGRKVYTIENYHASAPSSSSSTGGCSASADTNRITTLTYTPDGQVQTLTAVNSNTGSQTTEYVYGTTLADSDVAASLLLRSTIYPGSVSGSDQVWLTYNRLAQRTSLTDQNGSVHQYDYDLLGRLTQDRVTTLGTGVDGAVRRIETTYEVRGLMEQINSLSSATVGSGSTLNAVQFSYNDFAQSIRTYQAHAGAVDTSTTPSVQMGYADGSANTVRPTSLTYPNGRVLTYGYGSSGGVNDQASRIGSLIDDDGSATHLADYTHLGLGSVVQQDSPEADLRYTLISLTGTDDPVTGDIYTGLDLFGRIKDVRWRDVSAGTDLSRVKYGYDRDSNRIWRENPTDPNRHYDWKYEYDGLQRLSAGNRGELNSGHTGITNPQFGQCWTLDETGNWQGFRQDDTGSGTWSLIQDRTASPVNQITEINASTGDQWATPVYDANGNMTTIPRPDLPRPCWANLTADQWAELTVAEWSAMEVVPKFFAAYDAWNRLVTLTDGGTGETVQENAYDGRNYRIICQTYVDGSVAETRQYLYTDGWQVIEERLGVSTTPERQFVWGVRYIDDLVCRERLVTGTLDERLYALQDANWNVNAVADDFGVVQERYEYDAYGVLTILSPTFAARSTSVSNWATTYCGYEWDSSTGIFNVRKRQFVPRVGSWLMRDPDEYVTSFSLNEVVASNPLINIDPLGNDILDDFANFGAGIGDSLTFGVTYGFRQLWGGNNSLDTSGLAYQSGEWTETVGEILITLGGASLKCAAKTVAQKAGKDALRQAVGNQAKRSAKQVGQDVIQQAANKFKRQYRRKIGRTKGGIIHHKNPLFGHHGGIPTRFPTGGLPDFIKNSSWNFKYMSNSQMHAAAHRWMRRVEGAADWIWPQSGIGIPLRIGSREIRRMFIDPNAPDSSDGTPFPSSGDAGTGMDNPYQALIDQLNNPSGQTPGDMDSLPTSVDGAGRLRYFPRAISTKLCHIR